MAYDPREYWTDRLSRDYTLRGVGHAGYSERYNAWIYRRKARVLGEMLSGLEFEDALDVGSGTGWVVAQLLQRGSRVTGVDVAPPAVERLRAQFPQHTFVRLTLGAEELPFADASFDLATIMDVAYHVTDDAQWAAAISEIARVLRPGGRLIATDGFGRADDSQAAHVRFRGLGTWETLGREVGLGLDRVAPLYRWLSRPRRALFWLPSSVRGPLEYAMETAVPREPHLRCARFERQA